MRSPAPGAQSFGEWLRQQRRALDLTQEELARQVGCSAITLRKLEAEERRPSKQIAERLAEVLGVPAEGRADFLRFARGDPFAAPAPGLAQTPDPAPLPPSGTVTFLFTDIEGSAALAQQYPASMPQLLARHHALLTQAIEANGGYVFQIVGDAFCAAFHTPQQAIGAALAAQRGLQTADWDAGPVKVRMGLHSGSAQAGGANPISGGYSGYSAMMRTQRVMAAGHGQQVLLSNATAQLAQAELPPAVTLLDLGEHRLKGLANPERLWQLAAPGLAADFPPLQTRAPVLNNLPVALTSFVGREENIRQVRQLLAGARLVTLTGAGGSGKTRLALEVAAGAAVQFPDGVCLIELAPLTEPALVAATLAARLDVRVPPARPVIETLTDYLRPRRVLLVLDNCEHLVQACAELAEALLRACPSLTILATSREGLAIAGEALYQVPSLSLPSLSPGESLEALARSEAVQLFIERARAVLPGFALTSATVGPLVQICRNLDGIPLAIELAAARMKALDVIQIAARLDDRFRLLTGGSRTALPRHQTLQALIDWSHDLLSQPEQVLLRRLAVFNGGWTLEGAEAVGAIKDEGGTLRVKDEEIHPSAPAPFFPRGFILHPSEVLDLLAGLVNKSLVLVERQPNAEPRYHMLETIRQYAWARLAASGEAGDIRQRHAQYYLRLLKASRASGSLNRMEEEEFDNLRAGVTWSLTEASDAATSLNLIESVDWAVFGNLRQTRDSLEVALARADKAGLVETNACAAVLEMLGNVLALLGEYEAGRARMTESLALFRALGDRPREAYVLNRLGWLAREHDDPENARQLLEASLALAHQLGDQDMIAAALPTLGGVWVMLEDAAQAQAVLEEGLALMRARHDGYGAGWALNHMGQVAQLRGQYLRAARLQQESREAFGFEGDPRPDIIRTSIEHSLGEIELAQGHAAAAVQHFTLSLESAQGTYDPAGVSWALAGLAGAAALNEEPDRAARLWGAAEALRKSLGARHALAARANRERLMAAAREQLGEAAFAAAWAEGQGLTLEQALAEAGSTGFLIE